MDLHNPLKAKKNKTKRLAQLFSAVMLSSLVIFSHALYNGNYLLSISLFIIIAISAIGYYLSKQGNISLASNILLLMSSTAMLTFMWMFEGIRDEVLLIFPAIIVFSLHLNKPKFAFYLYLIVCINIFIIAYLNQYGYIHNHNSGSTLTSAITIISILFIIGYSVWLLSQDLIKVNKTLLESQNKLEQRVKERTVELENSLAELTQTQDQLVEAEKMASLGRLVAGVAHEINTPLGIAITATSHLEYETKLFNEQFIANQVSKSNLEKHLGTSKESSNLILSNLTRAANLIQSFKEVAVDQTNEELREFNLHNYINEVLISLHPKIKNTKHTVNLQCSDSITVMNAPGALAQIITNLFVNAITHAFEGIEQGSINIAIQRIKKETTTPHIELIFKDDGKGITKENREKIFEPFYTTKRNQGGSGLGMHIVYNLVTQSLQGHIKCESELDKGTKFTLTFPQRITLNNDN